jgi:hypothetical protein
VDDYCLEHALPTGASVRSSCLAHLREPAPLLGLERALFRARAAVLAVHRERERFQNGYERGYSPLHTREEVGAGAESRLGGVHARGVGGGGGEGSCWERAGAAGRREHVEEREEQEEREEMQCLDVRELDEAIEWSVLLHSSISSLSEYLSPFLSVCLSVCYIYIYPESSLSSYPESSLSSYIPIYIYIYIYEYIYVYVYIYRPARRLVYIVPCGHIQSKHTQSRACTLLCEALRCFQVH